MKQHEEQPTVALVMATYNRAGMIGEAIDSLLNQTRPLDEFHIVDDGSSDNTHDIVESYGDRITLITQPNRGRPAALNRVIPDITADYIWLFDDDDIALPHALQTHLDFLADSPQYDFSYSPHYFFEHSADCGPDDKQLSQCPDIPPERFFLWMMESHFAPVQLQGMLIPTACYRKIGLFDETLLRSQDRDMMLRIARHFRAGRITTPTWGFRQHAGARGAGSQSHAANSRYDVWRSYKYAVFKKLRDSLALSEYLPECSTSDAPALSADSEAYRRALLQRAAIMAIHGLSEEALDDFRAFASELATTTSPLTIDEDHRISELSMIHNLESKLPRGYFLELGKAARPNLQILKLLLRGTYWGIAREFRRLQFRKSCVMSEALATLIVGYAGHASLRYRRS